MFDIKIENLKTKKIYDSGFTPTNHKTACILISKMTNYVWRRIYLEPVLIK